MLQMDPVPSHAVKLAKLKLSEESPESKTLSTGDALETHQTTNNMYCFGPSATFINSRCNSLGNTKSLSQPQTEGSGEQAPMGVAMAEQGRIAGGSLRLESHSQRESLRMNSSEQERFFCGRSFSIPSSLHESLTDELAYAGDEEDLENFGFPLDFLLSSSRRCSADEPQGWYRNHLSGR